MTPAEARKARAQGVYNRRMAEFACAMDFLRNGDTVGIHAKRCVFGAGDACARTYDPGPVPDDRRMYEGTSLGALWGLNTLQSYQLAGWNLRRRKEYA